MIEHDAYFYWLWHTAPYTLRPFNSLHPPRTRNLRELRLQLCISTNEAARQIGISRAAYCRMERRSLSGNIQLKTLENAVKKLRGRVAIEIRPIEANNFAEQLFQRLLPFATGYRSLNWALQHKQQNPATRRELGLSERWRPSKTSSTRSAPSDRVRDHALAASAYPT